LWWYVHGKPFVSYETMVEMMVMSTSNADNVHGVEGDNSNPYRTMTFPLRFQHLWIELKKIQFGIKM